MGIHYDVIIERGHLGEPLAMATSKKCKESTKKKVLLDGYMCSLNDADAKKPYQAKIAAINSIDPYQTERKDWIDDVNLWPSITYINVGMYLLVTPSPYSGHDLLNYKSLDCYRNFLAG